MCSLPCCFLYPFMTSHTDDWLSVATSHGMGGDNASGWYGMDWQVCWFPPQVDHSAAPVADHYHLRRLFLWMPRKMWKIDFQCPRCKKSLTSKGLYNRVCLVLDIKDYYYLAAEYMKCRVCKGTFIVWDHQTLGQLADGVRSWFPVILTYKYACDKSIICLLYGRTLGNSPTAVQHTVHEAHSAYWMHRQIQFLSDCQKYSAGLRSLGQAVPSFDQTAPFRSLLTMWWFLVVYVRDVSPQCMGPLWRSTQQRRWPKSLLGLMRDQLVWPPMLATREERLFSVITALEGMKSFK